MDSFEHYTIFFLRSYNLRKCHIYLGLALHERMYKTNMYRMFSAMYRTNSYRYLSSFFLQTVQTETLREG